MFDAKIVKILATTDAPTMTQAGLHKIEQRFAAWVDQCLTDTGKSVVECGAALNLAGTQISKMRNGRRGIKAAELIALEQFFGIPAPSVHHTGSGRLATSDGHAKMGQLLLAPIKMHRTFLNLPQKMLRVDENRSVVARGEYVVWVPYWKARTEPKDGDLVVARFGRALRVRLLVKDHDTWGLAPKNGTAPLMFKRFGRDKNKIVGLVIWRGHPLGD